MKKSELYLNIINNVVLKCVPESRVWWPKYLYHFTNIDNAVSILQDGALYSRNQCHREDKMINENASDEIIAQTDSWIKDYVRLFFRPQTPTQYRNEGYRCEKDRFQGANVPVPIFFAFRSYEILGLEGTKFSDRTLAGRTYKLSDSIEDFTKLDFYRIFHSGSTSSYSPIDSDDIRHKKQAEVIIQESLNLDFLDNIWCRSSAEYTTLCRLLKDKGLFDKYRDKIGMKAKLDLFYGQYLYVDSVILNSDIVEIKLVNTNCASDVILRCVIFTGGEKFSSEIRIVSDYNVYNISLEECWKLSHSNKKYSIELFFNDSFVYREIYSDEIGSPY